MNGATNDIPAIEGILNPKLDASEVAAVFTAPLESFLNTALPSHMAPKSSKHSQPWYRGDRFPFDKSTVRMYNFYMPITSSSVTWTGNASGSAQTERKTFRIFGLTAKIMVEAAQIAFDREPQFEHNAHVGDENLIRDYIREGRMVDDMRSRNRDERGIPAKNDEKEKKGQAKI